MKNILKYSVFMPMAMFLLLTSIASGEYLGTRVISNGATYEMHVGDVIIFRNTRQPRSSQYYAFNWYPSDESLANFEGRGANSPHLKVFAKETGEFTIMATLDFSEQFGLYDFKNYNYEDKITVVISDPQNNVRTSTASSSVMSTRKIEKIEAKSSNEIKVSVISGTIGANSLEGCENLYDGDVHTKWCVTNFSSAYAIFELSSAASINGLMITTANDNSVYKGRNPKDFALYGSNTLSSLSEYDSSWEFIAEKRDDKVLDDIDYKIYRYSLGSESKKYKYYKLEITKTKGANVMQMSEFSFLSGRYKFIPSNIHSNTNSHSQPSSSNSYIPAPSYIGIPFLSNDERCDICHGTGICQVCSGARRYYVSGYGVRPGSYVNCKGCNGSGKCEYCNGTGKQ